MRSDPHSPRHKYQQQYHAARKADVSCYCRFHTSFLGYNFRDRETGRILRKAQLYDVIMRDYEIIKHKFWDGAPKSGYFFAKNIV